MDRSPQLATEFAPHFRSRRCDPDSEPQLMDAVYELRFNVYCRECAFLPASDYPDGREKDAYDRDASHFCAFNLRGELVGYVRLVYRDHERGLPFESHCTQLYEGAEPPPSEPSAEISRLMVRGDYRRRRGDTLAGVTNSDAADPALLAERRSNSPQILLSLYRLMYAYSKANGVRYWYAAMERFLARSLTRYQINDSQVFYSLVKG